MNNKELTSMLLSVLDLLQEYSNRCEDYPEDIRPETMEDHDYSEDKILNGFSQDLQSVEKEIGAENLRSILGFVAESHEHIRNIINRGIRDLIVDLELEDTYKKYNRF